MDFRSITNPYIPGEIEGNPRSENVFNGEDGFSVSFNKEYVCMGCTPNDDGRCGAKNLRQNISAAEEGNLLYPVAAFEEGEGLPYAPIDWPNPGDTWSWRVGKRVNNGGHFQDRFLYPPRAIVPISSPKFFASKVACQQFLKANFPDRDHEAFFASFSWKIPAKMEDSQQDGENKVVTSERQDSENYRVSKRGRRIKPSYVELEDEDDGQDFDVSEPSIKRKTVERPRRASSNNKVQGDDNLKRFDKYLNSIEGLLNRSNTCDLNTEGVSISEPELAKAREKLSSLLIGGRFYLASSEIVQNGTNWASQIRRDSNLTVNQLKLKLVHELPEMSETYRETRKTIEELELFFKRFEAGKSMATSMKNAYEELREKSEELQERVDAGERAVKVIGEEMELLRSKLGELGRRIIRNKAAKEEVALTQRMLAKSLPSVVQEIKASNLIVGEMEVKRMAALAREAEIIHKLDKMEKDFSFKFG